MIVAVNKDEITADVAARLVAAQFPPWAGLPVLARQLPLPIPESVAMGRPSDGFPRPWSVYRWLAGEPASTGQIADLTGFASGLAGFLTALQAIDGAGVGARGPDRIEHARRGLPLDEATWARGRGWALWKALVNLGREEDGGDDAQAPARVPSPRTQLRSRVREPVAPRPSPVARRLRPAAARFSRCRGR
jgi:aminoglycoside phosphotransferase (APT) family kinase protein